MKIITNTFNLVMCFFLTLLLGCTEKETQVEVSSVSLNTATIEMVEGETFSLVATVLPKDAEYDGVTWASSNASVASVNSGTVTALKEGTATITASAGGKSATCSVKVSAKIIAVTSISLDKASLSIQVGDTETLTATIQPDNATDKAVVWTSSEDAIASVSNGKITAHKSGKATITAKSGTCSAECEVTVSVNTESITLDKTTLSLSVGETAQLTATVKPDDATDKTVTWSSSDESVAKVDNGKVAALKSGKATITAKCGDKTAECAVTVTVPVSSITLDKSTLSLVIGESATLTAVVKPDDATDQNVTWTSSDESVAKVDNGKVTAIKSGKATITAKCDGKTAVCAVSVTVPVSSITLDKSTLSLVIGESATLTAVVKPDDATDQNVTWTSSDESVAKVDNGKVTAIKSGKATITAKCDGKTAVCAVSVTVPVSSITIDKTTLSLAIGEFVTLIATVKPDDATDKTVVWSSSDESIAKVDNGKVTALKIGSATVTATAASFSVSCKVTVIHPDNIIYYTSTDGNIVKPFNESAFGANIISNEYQDNVGKIVFDGSVTFIGNGAFNKSGTLYSMILPNKVTDIGDRAFEKSGITQIKLPDSILSIGKASFRYSRIRTITIPQNVQIIGTEAFSWSNLESIIFSNNNIKIIEPNTFERCYELSKVVLPKNLEVIKSGAFYLTKNLKEIIIPESVNELGEAAFCWSGLENIEIPGNISVIPESCFGYCNLKSIVFSEGLEVIHSSAFIGSGNIRTLILPSTILKIGIGTYAFSYLSEMYIKATVPPILSVSSESPLFKVYVPRSSVDAYKEKWSAYKDYIIGYDF